MQLDPQAKLKAFYDLAKVCVCVCARLVVGPGCVKVVWEV